MMIKLAPSLLLSVLCCPDEVAAFNAVRPAAVRHLARLSMTNDFDADYDVDVDRRGNIQNIAASELNRRAALAKFASTAAAGAIFLGGNSAAVAATPEFSPSPTSDASIARMGYDGKALPSPPAAAPVEKAPAEMESKEPPAVVSVPVDRSRLDPSVSLPRAESLVDKASLIDPRVVVGSAALFGVMAIGALMDGDEEAPPLEPGEEAPQPTWALAKPTPYGIQNPDGTNPFIKEVLDYCEGGKVSQPCASSIKLFLDDIAETGAVATSDEAEVIAGYLNSLGDDASSKTAGAAFASYLDALSSGSAPPPTSAKAVQTYLDVLSGSAPGPSEAGVSASVSVEATPIQVVDMSAVDGRLTNIEGRVTSLESKVDQIPDLVFAKIEAWQSSNEERLSAEVKKIVDAMSLPPAAEPVIVEEPVVVEEPVFVEAAPIPEPAAPVPEPEPQAPLVPASPIGAIPVRSSMPQPMEGGGPKKRYGFGGGAWKTTVESTSAPSEPAAAVIPEPAPEVVEAAPVEAAPVVPAAPIGAIPMRSGMPQPMEGGGPKKAYGIGGGASWKTSE